MGSNPYVKSYIGFRAKSDKKDLECCSLSISGIITKIISPCIASMTMKIQANEPDT
jgi:hypothetical protein